MTAQLNIILHLKKIKLKKGDYSKLRDCHEISITTSTCFQ
ncbi:hypothetical protein MSIBF_A2530004 [groundwater metagenome]|uniref:Uncharacterized protein n=1 Tax=groundwater metagenome TaxID=717931 RepID=A0A098EC63_9ZZZZ